MSSAVSGFVPAVRKCSKKCLAQKEVRFGSLPPIPMIQAPFCSSCVALQYEPGMKFFHRAIPEIHGIQKSRKSSTTAWYFCTFGLCACLARHFC